jgi:hypothetical protein
LAPKFDQYSITSYILFSIFFSAFSAGSLRMVILGLAVRRSYEVMLGIATPAPKPKKSLEKVAPFLEGG